MLPKVTIIFPVHNGLKATRQCLASIKRLSYPQKLLTTIVIDNASTDKTVSVIKNQFPWVKLIRFKQNLGFAKAVNLALKRVKTKFILITNNDVVFHPDYLKILINYLLTHPQIGIIGGKVYYLKKNTIAFCGARFNFYTGLIRLGRQPNKIGPTDWVSGCNLLVRKEVLDKIGHFDEQFYFYFEDFDLCLRAKKAGFLVSYHPRALLYHQEGATIDKTCWQTKSQLYYDGKTRLLFKHASKLQLASSLAFQFTLGLAYQLLILKHQNYVPAFKALLKNLKTKND